jgi:acetylglutamate kinase
MFARHRCDIKRDKPIVIMHGAGNDADELGEKLGYPRNVTSPQGFTSLHRPADVGDIRDAACGKINTFLVERLQSSV